jgi:hypothetical protein
MQSLQYLNFVWASVKVILVIFYTTIVAAGLACELLAVLRAPSFCRFEADAGSGQELSCQARQPLAVAVPGVCLQGLSG